MENQEAQKSSMTPLIIGVVLLILLAGGYFLLRGNTTQNSTVDQLNRNNEQTAPENSAVQETPVENLMEDQGIVAESDVVTVTMEAGAFYFTPDTITVKQGQTVRIELSAMDMMHDYNIDELNVDGPVVKSGESTTIEFVADRVGNFEYYCSVGQHRANGQVGTLTVTE